jgi:GTP-binding protein HflX
VHVEIDPKRNLERATGRRCSTAPAVIVEIFHRHAKSREARLQVEIARLNYLSPRLRETGGGGDRQRGGIGGKGPARARSSSTAARSATASPSCAASSTAIAHEGDVRRAGGRSSSGWRSWATPTRARAR